MLHIRAALFLLVRRKQEMRLVDDERKMARTLNHSNVSTYPHAKSDDTNFRLTSFFDRVTSRLLHRPFVQQHRPFVVVVVSRRHFHVTFTQ